MKFDHVRIQNELCDFWKENKEKMHYFIGGKEVFPEKVSSCNFQLKEEESSDDYNFEVTTLNLRVQIGCVEEPYNATFLIKVVPEIISENEFPEESIVGIHNNLITLKKKSPYNH